MRALAATGGLVAAGLLAACSGTPGAAAVVDDRVITTSDVQVASDELAALGQQFDVSAVVSVLIQEPTVTAIAQEHGVGVSDADAVALLDQVAASLGQADDDTDPGAGEATPETFSEPTIAIARYSLASGNLQEADDADAIGDEVSERLAALDVDVNPRFGTADENQNVTALTSWPWIAAPEADAS
ncbi:hypothetical protein KIN34_01070 [Cellulomonas sp. DKR-3]|uniref:SurA N-terminal domain-containing protein n=1 Tax=Cellulomonas fulva TaxID=2835530 RepID=A0ABS5TUQ8_9CELL|nr:SurA N-terminal domain-containing protein [Cellulomonas fulva]MBT0992882.1 hypothetical protein [Cellulomonas fulva]